MHQIGSCPNIKDLILDMRILDILKWSDMAIYDVAQFNIFFVEHDQFYY
jgi:hypothetical protein